jgi:catechol 2,3-dioxygenase-like lactoylglutathione lyase family enzyme
VTVRRIVSIAASDIRAGKRFYQDVLGLELLMDHGWIAILARSSR